MNTLYNFLLKNSPALKIALNNENKVNLLLEKINDLENLNKDMDVKLDKLASYLEIGGSYRRWQRAEEMVRGNSGLNVGNNGERLVPGYSNSEVEIIRHRSTYLFFKKIIESDLVNNPNLVKSGIKILDLGCGVGHGTRLLSEVINCKVVGLEIDNGAIAYAQNNYSSDNIEYVNDSIENYLEYSNNFDYIVSRHALEHIDMSLNEIGDKLRFEYRAMLSVPYKEEEGNQYHKHINISENDFSTHLNKEFFYEDLEGNTDQKPFAGKVTNSFTCVMTRDKLLPVNEILKFPLKPVKLYGLEKDFLTIFND